MARHRHAHPYDPLAALTPKQQQKRAYALLGPLIAQINAQFDRQASAGGKSISDYTDLLAQRLGPMADQTHGLYAAAEAQQRADDKALADRLGALGGTVGAQAGGATGVPTGSVPDLASIGQRAANTGFASGSSKLAQLLAQGTATESYGRELPGIARMGGAQAIKDLTAQLESGRQSSLESARGKIPSILQQIQADELQKAIASQSGLISSAKLQQGAAQFGAKQGIAQATLAERARHDKATENAKMVANDISRYRATHPHSTKTGGFTPNQTQKMRSNAIEAVKALKHGQQNPHYDPTSTGYHNGVPDKQQYTMKPGKFDAPSAYKYLRNHGVPPPIADWAVGRVYGAWKTALRGQGQRPR